jgi:hypothetical protein
MNIKNLYIKTLHTEQFIEDAHYTQFPHFPNIMHSRILKRK